MVMNVPPKPKTVIFVSKTEDIPECEHWAIFVSRTYSYDGGHGYGQIHGAFVEYTAYLDKAEWEQDIVKQTQSAGWKPLRAAHISPATITTSIKVKTGWTPPPAGFRGGSSN